MKLNYSRDENVMIKTIIMLMNKRENMGGKNRMEMKNRSGIGKKKKKFTEL